MPSHAVAELLEVRPGLDPEQLEVRMRLMCGCEVSRRIEESRLCETVDGKRLVVGKYPCPEGHPVRRP